MSSLYVGIDGGATSTKVVVGNEDSIVGEARTGPANPNFLSMDQVVENVGEGILLGLRSAGRASMSKVERICAGIAGLSNGESQEEFKKKLGEKLPEFKDDRLILIPDSELAWYASFKGGPGIIMIAGTGYIVYGQEGSKVAKSPIELPDKYGNIQHNMGGRNIAYHTLKKVKEVYRKKTDIPCFLEELLPSLPGMKHRPYEESLDLILEASYSKGGVVSDKDIASLAPHLLRKYTDPLMQEVLSQAATEVATHIKGVAQELHLEGSPIALFGSVLSNPHVMRFVEEHVDTNPLTQPETQPLYAALSIARGEYGTRSKDNC